MATEVVLPFVVFNLTDGTTMEQGILPTDQFLIDKNEYLVLLSRRAWALELVVLPDLVRVIFTVKGTLLHQRRSTILQEHTPHLGFVALHGLRTELFIDFVDDGQVAFPSSFWILRRLILPEICDEFGRQGRIRLVLQVH